MNNSILYKVSYGLYMISSIDGDKINGQIANTVFQVTSEPARIAIAINKKNLTHDFIESSKVFTVSILTKEADMKLIGNFGFKSGREIDKFKDYDFKTGANGAPILIDKTNGYIECKLVKDMDLGSHSLFTGLVTGGDVFNDKETLTYDYYHNVIKGKSPRTAPTFIEEKKEAIKGGSTMAKYRCTICGYIYDPDKGDAESSIPAGTPFEKLPDDWICPVCGVGKEQFEKID